MIEVADAGAGMAPEHAAAGFERASAPRRRARAPAAAAAGPVDRSAITEAHADGPRAGFDPRRGGPRSVSSSPSHQLQAGTTPARGRRRSSRHVVLRRSAPLRLGPVPSAEATTPAAPTRSPIRCPTRWATDRGHGRPRYNEEVDLERSVRRCTPSSTRRLPVRRRTPSPTTRAPTARWDVARRLRDELEGVEATRLEGEGRGRARRAVGSASDAAVLADMDAHPVRPTSPAWSPRRAAGERAQRPGHRQPARPAGAVCAMTQARVRSARSDTCCST